MGRRQKHKGMKRPRSWHRRFDGPGRAWRRAAARLDRSTTAATRGGPVTDYRSIADRIPDAEWDVHIWPKGRHYVFGRIDVADRKRLVLTVLEAAQAAQDRPGRDETPADGGTDGSGQESAAERRTRDHRALAQQWSNEARGADPALGQVYALTAIAHAILAGQETP